MLIDAGTTRRRPDTAQRRFVEARDQTCVFPGCRMPATDCDMDHIEPHSHDGPTSVGTSPPAAATTTPPTPNSAGLEFPP